MWEDRSQPSSPLRDKENPYAFLHLPGGNLPYAAQPGIWRGSHHDITPWERDALGLAARAYTCYLGGMPVCDVDLETDDFDHSGVRLTQHMRFILARGHLAEAQFGVLIDSRENATDRIARVAPAIKWLAPVYKSPRGMLNALTRGWLTSADLLRLPWVVRNITALAQQLWDDHRVPRLEPFDQRDNTAIRGHDRAMDRLWGSRHLTRAEELSWAVEEHFYGPGRDTA